MDRPGSATRRHAGAIKRVGTFTGLEILFEDSVLLVVNKPAGLLTVPLPRRRDEPSVYAQLLEYFRSRKRTPHVVHRIDRDTSGLVVFAKDARTQQALKAQFIRREPERVYLAVVSGHPSPSEGTWRDRLAWNRTALVQQETDRRDPRGVEAISRYRVVETAARRLAHRSAAAHRQAQPDPHPGGAAGTSARRRAAVHGAADAARPRIGPRGFPRQALHAWRLGFDHPVDGRPLVFEAPLPGDMASLIGQLALAEPV